MKRQKRLTGRSRWTEADFEDLSWHDNHVHAVRLAEGSHGTGELTFDIDFIVEWVKTDSGIRFAIAPADLVFREVTALRLSLDYAGISAAMAPFSILGIERRREQRERYEAQVWRLEVSFPAGEIEFEAAGFTQTLRGPAVLADAQVLTRDQRNV